MGPTGGTLVGALADASFAVCRIHLAAGQTLVLYTDGLTEVRPGGEFFGENRLTAFLADRTNRNANELVRDLAGLIADFEPPPDDVAILALGVPAIPLQYVSDKAEERDKP